jgi:transglutaminase-like putative cysteine protease
MGRLAAEGGADPSVRLAAERIIGNDLPPRAYEAECARVLRFVRQACRYTLDPRGVEQIKKPKYVLFEDSTRLTDCDDQSTLFAALCLSLGHEAGFRALKADPRRPSEYSHVYALVRPRGSAWLPADPIEPRCPLGVPPEKFHRCWGGTNWTIHPANGTIRRDGGSVCGVGNEPEQPFGSVAPAAPMQRFLLADRKPAVLAQRVQANPGAAVQPYIL